MRVELRMVMMRPHGSCMVVVVVVVRDYVWMRMVDDDDDDDTTDDVSSTMDWAWRVPWIRQYQYCCCRPDDDWHRRRPV